MGWRFWVDGRGKAVRGPVGRYGGTSGRAVFAAAGGVALFLAINLWALSAIGLFDGTEKPQLRTAPLPDDPTPSPSPATPPKVSPTTRPSTPAATRTPKPRPTVTPTKTRTPKKPVRTEERKPEPTRTVTSTAPSPRLTPSRRTPTREELLEEYCRQQGWDPEWCDPDHWADDPDDPSVPPPGN